MNKRNILIGSLFATVLGVAVATSSAIALPGGHCQHEGKGEVLLGIPNDGRVARLIHRLDLTKEQQGKVWAVLDARRSEVRTRLSDLRDARLAMRDRVQGGAYDEAEVRKQADAIGTQVADLIVLGAGMRHEIDATLTPEQRKALEQRPHKKGEPRG